MISPVSDELVALVQQGRWPEALAAARRALQARPRDAEAAHRVGVLACQTGDLAEGIRFFRKALKLRADFAPAHAHLGDALISAGHLKEARVALNRALALAPQDAEAWCNLGYVAHQEGQFAPAVEHFRRAIALQPGLVPAYNHLAVSLMRLDRLDEAEAVLRQALEQAPEFVPARDNLTAVLVKRGRMDEAALRCRAVLAHWPQDIPTLWNFGVALTTLGDDAEAETTLLRALAADPGHPDAYSALAFLYAYGHGPFQQAPLALARTHGQARSARAVPKLSATAAGDPPRLRVGLVSGDLRHHPVSFFLEGLLPFLGARSVECHAYPTLAFEDEVTKRLRPHFASWTCLQGLSDEAAARRIHKDGLHVLIDLSGHTSGNRLGVFAWKPAPVQVTWLGYFASTGLPEMDYLVADAEGVPPDAPAQFTETVWRMPETRLCFTPPPVDLDVTPLPALRRGQPTLATFQAAAKIGRPVLRAWARILAALPSAKLRCHGRPYDDPELREQFIARGRAEGINPAQLEFRGALPYAVYLRAHGEADLILDTFPYPGGTTTCEALWMGVPTLTLAGETLLARQGASLLKAAGLPEWIARSEEEYVQKAAALAGDAPGLARLRAGLRGQMLASPLCDAPRFARDLEDALWGMWRARGGSPG